MKKLVSLLLAVCMCLSVGVMLTACNDEHTHTYKTEWAKNTTHHWHECEGADCTNVSDKAEHSYGSWISIDDAQHKKTCVCGAEILDEHTWGNDNNCTACGQTKPIVTTVTDEQWLAAMELGSNYVISGTQIFPGLGSEKYTDQRNGDKFEIYYEQIDVNDQVVDTNYNYAVIEGENFYYYSPIYDVDDQLLGYDRYLREGTVAENVAEILGDYLPDALRSKSDYTYNDTTKRYETTAELTVYGATVTDCYIAFTDGKLTSFGYTVQASGMELVTAFTVTYGNAGEITLPSGDQLLTD